jgi:hypothetical protein
MKSGPKPISVEQRFWYKVQKPIGEGCWIWTACKNTDGYGKMDNKLAHRISWIIHNGPIPEGMNVCHHCDNPPCVNPTHLFLGTYKDNTQDMVEKSRGGKSKGIDRPDNKLTEKQVREIKFGKTPKNQIECGKLYNISGPTIWSIRNGKKWKHIV